jgi:benzoyl-CoA-dihydrodiol lyase
VKGSQAQAWGLVDEVVPRSRLDATMAERANGVAERSDRPVDGAGVALAEIEREVSDETVVYTHVRADFDRSMRTATITVRGPSADAPADVRSIHEAGCAFWPLAVARELDDLVLHLRFNEPELGSLVLRTEGDPSAVVAVDEALVRYADDWLIREVVLLWKRTLKRIDVSSRSLFALIEPGSCFAGTLLELALAADRAYMRDEDATIVLTPMNLGPLPMGNGLTRLQSRFLDDAEAIERLRERVGETIDAAQADELGLVTAVYDELDWDDDVRIAIEERSSFSPDALSGLEANLRFAGPETMETKIFGRLAVWQNWIFSRPNATGDKGALPRYGTGLRASFDRRRV